MDTDIKGDVGMPKQKKKVVQIISDMETEQGAGSLAACTAHYWPTIKAALILYGKTEMPVLRNRPSSD